MKKQAIDLKRQMMPGHSGLSSMTILRPVKIRAILDTGSNISCIGTEEAKKRETALNANKNKDTENEFIQLGRYFEVELNEERIN